MNELENNTVTPNANGSSAGTQREQVLQSLAGVQARLEKNGVGAAFHRVAKADPVGDTGFIGSLFLHAMLCGPLAELVGEYLPVGHGELDGALAVGDMDGISALSETQDRYMRRPKSAFYPLGRNKSKIIKDGKSGRAAVSRNSHFSYGAQAELAFMFELMDTLNKLETQEAGETSDKRLHLVIRKSSSPAYQGVERRRRPRPEGLFNA